MIDATVCSLVIGGSVPRVVDQALDDTTLPPSARLMMWHLAKRLDLFEYREVKAESLANEMRVTRVRTSRMLILLVARGYLEESGQRRPRAFRMPWSRRSAAARAA